MHIFTLKKKQTAIMDISGQPGVFPRLKRCLGRRASAWGRASPPGSPERRQEGARGLRSSLPTTEGLRQVTITQEGAAAAWPCLRVLTLRLLFIRRGSVPCVERKGHSPGVSRGDSRPNSYLPLSFKTFPGILQDSHPHKPQARQEAVGVFLCACLFGRVGRWQAAPHTGMNGTFSQVRIVRSGFQPQCPQMDYWRLN